MISRRARIFLIIPNLYEFFKRFEIRVPRLIRAENPAQQPHAIVPWAGAKLLPGEPERPGRQQGLCARQDRGLSQRPGGHWREGIPRRRQQAHVARRPRSHPGT